MLNGTSPLPHPATQPGYSMGVYGSDMPPACPEQRGALFTAHWVGERAGTAKGE